ncbi:MAG: DUF302 domain-containing protein [Pyrinomonadaceae bacterium]|nr:DUF302 domain-containing protein [Pyrinomonadaceae bacterium]
MENSATQQKDHELKYGFSRIVPKKFEDAVQSIREALAGEGFGVLSEIRMDEKFKEKLGVDFRKYVILGACNPPLAYEAIQEEINIGLLLPCNVIVYEKDDGSVVSVIDARTMLSVTGNSSLVEAADMINARLQRAIASI